MAALLIVDDGNTLDELPLGQIAWSQRVIPLLLSPSLLARRAAARRVRVGLPVSCAACGSPRVAAIVYRMPSPQLESQAARLEVILGGCELRGGGLDPETGCLDCGAIHEPDPRAQSKDQLTH